jgi:hypothetical protein
MVPQKAMEQELKGQEKELTDDINNLNKKVTSSISGSVYLLTLVSQNISKSSSTMPRGSCVTSYVFYVVLSCC